MRRPTSRSSPTVSVVGPTNRARPWNGATPIFADVTPVPTTTRSNCRSMARPPWNLPGLLHAEVCLRRASGETVDRQNILRAGGEGDHQVDLGAEERVAAGRRDRLAPRQLPVGG